MADSISISRKPDSEARRTPKFTRCRTGCLRCRKRRRKCDERKPRCQNCIDKNFDCNYGMQVTFLPKNSITVSGELKRSETNGDKKGGYNKIQFVNEEPLAVDNLTSATVEDSTELLQSHSPTSVSGTSLSHLSGERRAVGNWNAEKGRHNPETELEEGTIPADQQLSSSPTLNPWDLNNLSNPPTTLEPPIPQSTFSAKDEFAVHGLLALGTQSAFDPIPASASKTASTVPGAVESPAQLPSHDVESGAGPRGPSTVNTPSRTTSGGEISPGFMDDILSVPSAPISTVHNSSMLGFDVGIHGNTQTLRYEIEDRSGSRNSETRKMKLLQYYRYNVAPWFGITALQMAANSEEKLLPALLALSEACLLRDTGHRLRAVHSGGTTTPPCSERLNPADDFGLYSNSTEEALSQVFGELRRLVLDVSESWAKADIDMGDEYGYKPPQSFVDAAYGLNLEAAIYWMGLRIDLGKALINNIPLHIPLPSHPIPSLALLCRAENTHSRVGHYAQVLLWLCGKALTTYHQDKDQVTSPQTWLQVFEELTQWHYLRPQEFQPMLELYTEDPNLNPGSEFPMLLFTNGAGALCNQLYHTAMLFMLECKPRTVLLSKQPSPVLSQLWHAQRVCGVALNNDRREWWDPCLLASFLVAARHMTHESQQLEIVVGFSRVQQLTGWKVGEYLTQLREEWSFLEGVE
ncbi:uncharacterized protein BJX67DRAFT_375813 [Aspergillus lucknowensis]|uniref:Zn(2)-C6 fungal-type domain-containing protein n=1 Tax=Aspergillus lucknowensis TaxID=176173 RepID=A0ABR4L8D6_9EURO